MSAIEIKRQWDGGPLRQFSSSRRSSWIPSQRGGFVGSYVCDRCGIPRNGVYRALGGKEWICAGCKELAKPKKTSAE